MDVIKKCYNHIIINSADKRTEDLPLVQNPLWPISLIALYLLVLHFGMKIMKNREPFGLRKIIQIYDVAQVITNAIIVYGVATSGWTTGDISVLRCTACDFSYKPQSMRMIKYIWLSYVLKMIDLVETVFFVLRKKFSQVSFLHTYHHASTVLVFWIIMKYQAGGPVTLAILINCSVHVVMYTYYFLSSLGGDWPEKLKIWKPRITILQMTQFAILLTAAAYFVAIGCDVPKLFLAVNYMQMMLILKFFYDYYKELYVHKNKIK